MTRTPTPHADIREMEPSMDGWIEGEIWSRRDENVREQRHGIVNGAWGIDFRAEPEPGAHVLTHMATGRRVACFTSREAALIFAGACDEVGDWSKTDDGKLFDADGKSPAYIRDLCWHRAELRGLEWVDGLLWRLRGTAGDSP